MGEERQIALDSLTGVVELGGRRQCQALVFVIDLDHELPEQLDADQAAERRHPLDLGKIRQRHLREGLVRQVERPDLYRGDLSPPSLRHPQRLHGRGREAIVRPRVQRKPEWPLPIEDHMKHDMVPDQFKWDDDRLCSHRWNGGGSDRR
jgi:hypothetical protein